MTTSIDLSYFCSLELARPYIMQPWTRAGFTYATDGHIMVRVPARADVPDNSEVPDAERVFRQVDFSTCFAAPLPKLPPIRFRLEDLSEPGDLPACYTILDRETVGFRGAIYQVNLMHLVFWLPDVECGRARSPVDPLPFRFANDGVGCVMPVRAETATYDLDALSNHSGCGDLT